MTDPRPRIVEDARDAASALRTFFNIADRWKLSTGQAMALLGFHQGSRGTFLRWKRSPERARLTRDQIKRLSYVFWIYKNLQVLLPHPDAADEWLRRPAPLSRGRPVLEHMLSGRVADLFEVLRYLDAELQEVRPASRMRGFIAGIDTDVAREGDRP